MDRLTIEQRVKIIKTYYKCGASNVATFRAIRSDFGRHNRPSTQAIGKLVKKFEESGSVSDIIAAAGAVDSTDQNLSASSQRSKKEVNYQLIKSVLSKQFDVEKAISPPKKAIKKPKNGLKNVKKLKESTKVYVKLTQIPKTAKGKGTRKKETSS